MAKDADKVLNTTELGEFLAVSTETIAKWCAEGRLPAFKIGGQWRVRLSDLNRVITGKVEKNFRKKEDRGKALF